MDDKRFYFLLGFMCAIFVAIIIVTTMEPLEASGCLPGECFYNPLYVKIVE